MPSRAAQSTKARSAAASSDAGARDKAPVRDKGKRTREGILTAAEVVFERDGFLAARVADIARAAKVAHGTFYTYFDSKEDVFREVASNVVEDIYRQLDAAVTGQHAEDLIHAANTTFLDLYARHAPMLGLIEQVATFDEHFRDMRLQLRNRLVRRCERAIERMAKDHEVNLDGLDQRILAHALAGMVENFAYAWFILKEPFERESALAVLDGVWIHALGVRPSTSKPARRPRASPSRRNSDGNGRRRSAG